MADSGRRSGPTTIAIWRTSLRTCPPTKLDVPCRIGSDQPVTLRFLAADYLDHLSHHLHQIGLRAASAG